MRDIDVRVAAKSLGRLVEQVRALGESVMDPVAVLQNVVHCCYG